ncbi:MAG: carbohydrate-binding family 9-like protein [Armatimonadetes bacterium]|nr:carbohydrate-binding family 9-like protein [Armatimonadota bacterium]MDE2207745.1 carbohydrate-binding family 9-like protein [Armatimonadota bacterium]
MPRHYLCVKTSSAFSIDGNVHKPEWDAAPWTEDFVDIEGSAKPLPALRTRAKLLWDDEYLYIAAELQEPDVWATLTQRDSVIFHDNDFEVFIDPDGDNHEYYELEINALNTVWDLLLIKPYRDGGPPVTGWDIAGLKSAVQVQGTLNRPGDVDRGWSVELALPWHALAECAHRRTPPQDGDQWRINFSRVEWDVHVVDGSYRKIDGRPEHNWVWSPQGAINMHMPEMWGYLQFCTAPFGAAAFRPDAAVPARELLMRIYFAEHAWRTAHGRFTANLADLNIAPTSGPSIRPPIHLEVSEIGFLASVTVERSPGVTERWHVKDDSRLWKQ